MDKKLAICAGCDRDQEEVGQYSEDDPVEEDGSYADGKFVCDDCYIRLIRLGQDVGTPAQLQYWAKNLPKVDAHA